MKIESAIEGFVPKEKVNMLISAAVVALASSAFNPLNARADSYSDGCKSYSSGDYEKAREQFECATRAYPKSWEVNYQLGNCYMRLKNRVRAEGCYQKALGCNPPATYKEHITKALAAVALNATGRGSASCRNTTGTSNLLGSTTGSLASSSQTFLSISEGNSDPVDPIQEKIEARRKQILNDGQKEAARIRDDRAIQRKELEAQGSQWFVSRSTGAVYTGIARDVAQEFDAETEHMVNQVLSIAKQKAGAVNSP